MNRRYKYPGMVAGLAMLALALSGCCSVQIEGIESREADHEIRLVPGESIGIRADVRTRRCRGLEYIWSCGPGQVESVAGHPAAVYRAPANPGEDLIALKVVDENGGELASSLLAVTIVEPETQPGTGDTAPEPDTAAGPAEEEPEHELAAAATVEPEPTSVSTAKTEPTPSVTQATALALSASPGSAQTPIPAATPFYVYRDGGPGSHYVPEAWMGCSEGIDVDQYDGSSPFSGASSIRISYTEPSDCGGQWAGIYWWPPETDRWCGSPGGHNLQEFTKLTFWARGEEGGEVASFRVGGLAELGVATCDSLETELLRLNLTDQWTRHEIRLDEDGMDRRHIEGGFAWFTYGPASTTFYLDEIRFE